MSAYDNIRAGRPTEKDFHSKWEGQTVNEVRAFFNETVRMSFNYTVRTTPCVEKRELYEKYQTYCAQRGLTLPKYSFFCVLIKDFIKEMRSDKWSPYDIRKRYGTKLVSVWFQLEYRQPRFSSPTPKWDKSDEVK